MAIIFFGIYVLFMVGTYLSTSKEKALILNALCCFACSFYLYDQGAHAGVIACITASVGSLYQLYLYKKAKDMLADKKVLLYKLIGSTVCTIVGIYAVY